MCVWVRPCLSHQQMEERSLGLQISRDPRWNEPNPDHFSRVHASSLELCPSYTAPVAKVARTNASCVSPLNCNQALQQVRLAFGLLTWLFMPPGKSACADQGDPDQRTFLQHVLMCDSFHKSFHKSWRTLCLCPACVWPIQPLELPPRQRLRGDDCSCLIKV